MTVAEAFLAAAMMCAVAPAVAVVLRGRSHRGLEIVTILATLAVTAYLALLLKLVVDGPRFVPNRWVYGLLASWVPLNLAAYLLSLALGREDLKRSFHDYWRSFLLLALVGGGMLAVIERPVFVKGYDWLDGRGTIHLGALGKAYLSYLLIGSIAVGYNLERTYRISPHAARYRLRLPLLGMLLMLGYSTFILGTGILYSAIGIGKLVASALPISFAGLMLAHGYMRGSIADCEAPVSRKVVYSSFTAFAASLFVIAIGLTAQIASLTRWSPDEILIVTVALLIVLVAALFLFSNRFQRTVRRYVDRNFYVNRYDYRTQWSNTTSALQNGADRDALLARIQPFLLDVFVADSITISLAAPSTRVIRPIMGRGANDPSLSLDPESPLFQRLVTQRGSLLLDRRPDDFTYIPIYAENKKWLDGTASQVVAPLLDHENLVGTIGLARSDAHDPFTFEDVALLDNLSSQIATSLRSLELAGELADSREIEVMSQLSSMLLHDLKNYLTPLKMVAANLSEYRDDPEVVGSCARDIQGVAVKIDRLIQRLSELRADPRLGMEAVGPNELVREVASALKVRERAGIEVMLDLQADHSMLGDRGMLRRVIENLVTNATEAMSGSGTLTIRTMDGASRHTPNVVIEVADTGCGMSPEFIREKLFRPFASTKKRGLGLGLYQCRSIIRAHGGELIVESEPGVGTRFGIILRAADSAIPKSSGPNHEMETVQVADEHRALGSEAHA